MADKKINIDMEVKGAFSSDILKSSFGKTPTGATSKFGDDIEASALKEESALSKATKLIEVAKLATPTLMVLSLLAVPFLLVQIVGFAATILFELVKKIPGMPQLFDFLGKSVDKVLSLFNKTDEQSKKDDQNTMQNLYTSLIGGMSDMFGNLGLTTTGGASNITNANTFGTTDEAQKLLTFISHLEDMYNNNDSIQQIRDEVFGPNSLLTPDEQNSLKNILDPTAFMQGIENIKRQVESNPLAFDVKTNVDGQGLASQTTSAMTKMSDAVTKGYDDINTATSNSVNKENGFVSTLKNMYSGLTTDLQKVAALLEFIRNPQQTTAPDISKIKSEVDDVTQTYTQWKNNQAAPYAINPIPYFTNPGLLLNPANNNPNAAPNRTTTGQPRTNTLYLGD
jgi:hypothetical protein